MEHLKRYLIPTLLLLILVGGFLIAGCVDSSSARLEDTHDINATAVAIAFNDSRVKSWINTEDNESYKILFVGPSSYKVNYQTMEAIVVEIDTQSAVDDFYVNVTNRSFDSIWHRPKRNPFSPPPG